MKSLALFLVVIIGVFGIRGLCFASEVPAIGKPAPDFKLPDAQHHEHKLSDFAGKWLVLYFYPKDDTPGCTKEACHFRDDLMQLKKLEANIVGISVDDSDSHATFAKKYNLPFPLLADAEGKVADSYGALSNFGLFKIAKRYTFLIDPKGNIAKTYLNVDTSRHSQEIIDDLKKLTEH